MEKVFAGCEQCCGNMVNHDGSPCEWCGGEGRFEVRPPALSHSHSFPCTECKGKVGPDEELGISLICEDCGMMYAVVGGQRVPAGYY
ncbi:MAG: hypothetical protein Greene07144_1077 [Parcubacteria group bacterium Greene0714_4]|nr:MAG: hypothetical protein Greene07144_1077 [Parcubacteria group bacterium Greene0714_4]